jgi:hypothetical protein
MRTTSAVSTRWTRLLVDLLCRAAALLAEFAEHQAQVVGDDGTVAWSGPRAASSMARARLGQPGRSDHPTFALRDTLLPAAPFP